MIRIRISPQCRGGIVGVIEQIPAGRSTSEVVFHSYPADINRYWLLQFFCKSGRSHGTGCCNTECAHNCRRKPLSIVGRMGLLFQRGTRFGRRCSKAVSASPSQCCLFVRLRVHASTLSPIPFIAHRTLFLFWAIMQVLYNTFSTVSIYCHSKACPSLTIPSIISPIASSRIILSNGPGPIEKYDAIEPSGNLK